MRERTVVSNKTPDKESNMDRFKVRAWDRQANRMIYMEELDHLALVDLVTDCGLILMQCTGLKDSERTLIYEADILEGVRRVYIPETLYGVKKEDKGEFFLQERFQLIFDHIDAKWVALSLGVLTQEHPSSQVENRFKPENFAIKNLLRYQRQEVKIIGNIYENPELLEESK